MCLCVMEELQREKFSSMINGDNGGSYGWKKNISMVSGDEQRILKKEVQPTLKEEARRIEFKRLSKDLKNKFELQFWQQFNIHSKLNLQRGELLIYMSVVWLWERKMEGEFKFELPRVFLNRWHKERIKWHLSTYAFHTCINVQSWAYAPFS